ncbi:hypothetical protein LTR47_008685 [Exophiala xenobiotica]|nr:hypothetical protein LTR47_008685 [Exophiala xenobiotica]KAK5243436.1 hypothetical protein LTS06_010799 [Exophiala xenobiotica]KAK5315799.1 hypothetical protein LTR93_009659 [Exophiala xenobiotica]KAK5346493.1 hypothetical protein LTR61_009695 [Exophiala xenobiotica]KAK5362848.1 hypothetical protein LTS03_009793 [Exophiala xenobiotica]
MTQSDSKHSNPSGTNANAPLNPAAASFNMPSSGEGAIVNGTSAAATDGTTEQQSKESKNSSKSSRPDAAPRTTTEQNIAEAGAGVKLTGAELKRQKAAEKAARRADKVAQKGAEAQVEAAVASTSKPGLQRRPSATKRESDAGGSSHHKRTQSSSGGKTLPLRGGQQLSQQQPPAPTATGEKAKPQQESKSVAMFSHLYPKERKANLASAGREIHPAVLSLGLQLRDYVIAGGNARCVATLLAFKKVIQSYTTPPGVALSRHLLTHLNHQIAYLRNARPLSMSQGNSIRWLKNLISTQPVDATDSEAKKQICDEIDRFIRERITLADEVIAREAGARIGDGDIVLTYGKSSVVEKTLVAAHKQGTKFKVIVVDSRPMFEGKNLARSLVRAGLQVQYALLAGLSDLVDQGAGAVTKCLLGASAMLGNGALLARAGTAMVALMAKECSKNRSRNVPVIVLCETVKFTAKAALDSVIMNEVAEPDALVETNEPDVLSSTVKKEDPSASASAGVKNKKAGGGGKDDDEAEDKDGAGKGLHGWKEQQGLFLLNLMYDVTPAEFIDVVVCEMGSLPPTAVPVVNGVHGDDQALA